MRTSLSLLFVVLSLVGLADASYITYETMLGIIPACGGGFDCGSVLTSQFAKLGPVPLSLLGMLFYLTVFGIAILHVLEFQLGRALRPFTNWVPLRYQLALNNLTPYELLRVLTAAGALFSLYLVFLMGVILEAWCLYCLVSAGTSMLLFLVSWYYRRFDPTPHTLIRQAWLDVAGVLYRLLAKPLFFMLDPEFVHDTVTTIGEWLGNFAVTKKITQWKLAYNAPSLAKTVDGIAFPNPVGLAAGFDYNGRLTQILPSVGFGFHTIGTVTLDPYPGNARPRLGRLPESKGLLINKGLKSVGARAVIQHLRHTPFLIPTGISIASTNTLFADTREQILDILQSFWLFEKSGLTHTHYELNISCPNTFGGEPFTTPSRLEVLLQALDRLRISRPVYLKMPIDQSEAETLALLAVADKHSIAGVVFGNLTKDKKNPAINPAEAAEWQQKKGNVSGKPTWERSNNLISLTKNHYQNRFTIIGTGGIFSASDALHKLNLGADVVQLITGMIFEGPQLPGQINLALHQRLLNPGSQEVRYYSGNRADSQHL